MITPTDETSMIEQRYRVSEVHVNYGRPDDVRELSVVGPHNLFQELDACGVRRARWVEGPGSSDMVSGRYIRWEPIDMDELHTTLCRELNHAGLLCGGECVGDELHTRAAEMDRNRAVILEQASDGALRHLLGTTPAHELAASGLTVQSLQNELTRRGAGTFCTTSACSAQTCTVEKCYYEPEGRADCPLC